MNTLSVSRAAMFALVMLCGALASCASDLTTNLAPITCDEPRSCVNKLDCSEPDGREVQICVQFETDTQGNTCLRENNAVVPDYPCICSKDKVTWIAREGQDKIDQRFQVWFIPVTTGLLNLRPSTEKGKNEHTRGISRKTPAADYKYTVVGGDPGCSNPNYDPRIRIDP